MFRKYGFYIIGMLVVLLGLTGCRKCLEEWLGADSYVKCTINGIKYTTTYRSYINPFGNFPIYRYSFKKGKGEFSYFFDCTPEKEKDRHPDYDFEFCLYLDAPLEVGQIYPVELLELPTGTDDGTSVYEKERVSYCGIIKKGSINFGNGSVEFTKIDIQNTIYEGRIAFTFPSLPERLYGDVTSIVLYGTFALTWNGYISLDFE